MINDKIRAQRENFAIYMMLGWRRFARRYMKGPLTPEALRALCEGIDYAIADIKQTQAARAARRKK